MSLRKWKYFEELPVGLNSLTMMQCENRYLYIIGGMNSNHWVQNINYCYRYDINNATSGWKIIELEPDNLMPDVQ